MTHIGQRKPGTCLCISIHAIIRSSRVRLRLRLRQCSFNQNRYRYHIMFTKTHQYTITIYSWYKMKLMHVGRPPLRSYLTTGMGATRRERACTRSERIHNAIFWRWGASHGGHRRDDHCSILTIGETPNPFQGRASADEIYGCSIHKWTAVTRPNEDKYSSNGRRRDAPHWITDGRFIWVGDQSYRDSGRCHIKIWQGTE